MAAFAAPALAQPAQPMDPLDPTASPLARVEEVIVTANKRETNLRDTPIAIAVVGAETLKNSQISSLLDIASSMPTLRMTTFESRSTALTVGIRGIVPNDANQPAREQASASIWTASIWAVSRG